MKSKKNGKIYVGSTIKDPLIRVKEHNEDSNTWSSNNKPFVLKYYEKYKCKGDVISREKFYKSGFGKQIKYLIIELVDRLNIQPESGAIG